MFQRLKSHLVFCLVLNATWAAPAFASLKPVAPRQVLSLDGQWQIAKGYAEQIPQPLPKGGATSDPFIDIDTLIIEPNFEKYVKDAFAPVGLMINFWKESVAPSAQMDIKVNVINDLYADWKGRLYLRILQDGKTVSQQKKTVKVASLGREVVSLHVQFPSKTGSYQIVAEITDSNGQAVRSYRDVQLIDTNADK